MNEPEYELTPKGVLCIMLGISQAEIVWDKLCDFSKRRLELQEDWGVPCIVLEGGGHVISVKKLAKNTESL